MTANSSIRILSPETANRIAAGEVVERPASVLKELLENSLDAGAGRIAVTVEGAGSRLIRVADNGRGMDREDISMCILRHATSKIREAADLERVASLGFRGEALPSIAAVSRLTIRSRPAAAEIGFQIQAEGGPQGDAEEAGCPPGTVVEVKDLFFNLPARRKFLKSPATESARLAECCLRLALSRPEVGFLYQSGKQKLYQLPADSDLRARTGALLGRETLEHMVEVDEFRDPLAIRGLAALPSLHRSDAGQVFVFVNGRFVRDKVLLHAISQAYEELLPANRRPVAVLHLTMDPSLLDVNVHPAKTEVRFRDSGSVHQALKSGLRAALGQRGAGQYHAPSSSTGEDCDPASLPMVSEAPAGYNFRRAYDNMALPDREKEENRRLSSDFDSSSPSPAQARHLWPLAGEEFSGPPAALKLNPMFRPVAQAQALAQLLGLYILAETPEGLLIIDQHAAYERLNYEELRLAWRDGVSLSQALLTAQPLDLTFQEMAAVENGREAWQRLGLELSIFGPRSIAVQALPPAWAGHNPEPLLRALLAEMKTLPPDSPEFIEKSLRSLACQRSVRKGQRLDLRAMQDLLTRLFRLSPPLTCPHGRPVAAFVSGEDLWRIFQRG
ncbi:MAG: DNA mismatch repair endonuclease MutL [Desulfarculales bacterium]|jgi:DNA mismatch repair protein MutL|nr:DNA mismatch repair endonuclease MutL [Desulfarculales bacterium]